MKNPYVQISIYSLSLLLLTFILQKVIQIDLPVISWYALGYFTIMTFGIHSLVSPYLESNNKQFISIFMGTLGLRMLLSLGFLLIYLLFSSKKEISFITYYLLLYLFFAGFEIYLLLSKLRADLKKGSKKG